MAASELDKSEIETKYSTNLISNQIGKRMKYSPKDNLMGDLNRDRFGEPIEKKTAKFVVPGPGSYEQSLNNTPIVARLNGKQIALITFLIENR
jgi:hypothetical protein